MTAKNRFTRALAALVLLMACTSALARGFLQKPELLDQIKVGVTTAKEVEQLLGPPAGRSQFRERNLVSMDYTAPGDMGKNRVDIGILIGADGVVRDIQRVPQYCD